MIYLDFEFDRPCKEFCQILQVGLVKVSKKGNIIDTLSLNVKPVKNVSRRTREFLNVGSNGFEDNSVSESTAYNKILKFIGNDKTVISYGPRDFWLLEMLRVKHHKPEYKFKKVDLLSICKNVNYYVGDLFLYNNKSDLSLGKLYDYIFGDYPNKVHNALCDAKTLYEIHKRVKNDSSIDVDLLYEDSTDCFSTIIKILERTINHTYKSNKQKLPEYMKLAYIKEDEDNDDGFYYTTYSIREIIDKGYTPIIFVDDLNLKLVCHCYNIFNENKNKNKTILGFSTYCFNNDNKCIMLRDCKFVDNKVVYDEVPDESDELDFWQDSLRYSHFDNDDLYDYLYDIY